MIPGSDRDHPTFVQSFRYAIEGLFTAIRTERNINVMLVLGVVTVVAGIAVGLDPVSGASSSFAADLSSLLSFATPRRKRSSTSLRRNFIPGEACEGYRCGQRLRSLAHGCGCGRHRLFPRPRCYLRRSCHERPIYQFT